MEDPVPLPQKDPVLTNEIADWSFINRNQDTFPAESNETRTGASPQETFEVPLDSNLDKGGRKSTTLPNKSIDGFRQLKRASVNDRRPLGQIILLPEYPLEIKPHQKNKFIFHRRPMAFLNNRMFSSNNSGTQHTGYHWEEPKSPGIADFGLFKNSTQEGTNEEVKVNHNFVQNSLYPLTFRPMTVQSVETAQSTLQSKDKVKFVNIRIDIDIPKKSQRIPLLKCKETSSELLHRPMQNMTFPSVSNIVHDIDLPQLNSTFKKTRPLDLPERKCFRHTYHKYTEDTKLVMKEMPTPTRRNPIHSKIVQFEHKSILNCKKDMNIKGQKYITSPFAPNAMVL